MELSYNIIPTVFHNILGAYIGAGCPNCPNIYGLGKTISEARRRLPMQWACHHCGTVSWVDFPQEAPTHNEYGEIHP